MKKEEIMQYEITDTKIIITNEDGESCIYDKTLDNIKELNKSLKKQLKENKRYGLLLKFAISLLSFWQKIVYVMAFFYLFVGIINEETFIPALKFVGPEFYNVILIYYLNPFFEKEYDSISEENQNLQTFLDQLDEAEKKHYEKNVSLKEEKLNKRQSNIQMLQNMKSFLNSLKEIDYQDTNHKMKSLHMNKNNLSK